MRAYTLLVERRTCDNCGAVHECPARRPCIMASDTAQDLKVKFTVSEAKIARLFEMTRRELQDDVLLMQHEIAFVDTRVEFCHRCWVKSQLSTAARTERAMAILYSRASGEEKGVASDRAKAKKAVEGKNKIVASLDDFELDL